MQHPDRPLPDRDDAVERWRDAPLDELVEHLSSELHPRMHACLPKLEALARKTFTLHGSQQPEQLSELLEIVTRLRAQLEGHLRVEELVVFPLVWADAHFPVDEPIGQMRSEHARLRVLLDRVRLLTDDFRLPLQATGCWRQLWEELEQFAHELGGHLRLEDEVLFPRALERCVHL